MPDGISSPRFLYFEFMVRMCKTIDTRILRGRLFNNVGFAIEAFSSMRVTTIPWDAACTLPASGTRALMASCAMQYARFVGAIVKSPPAGFLPGAAAWAGKGEGSRAWGC